MFKIHEIREMIRLVDQSSVQEFCLEMDGAKVKIKKASGQSAEAPVQTVVQPAVTAVPVAAPAVAAVTPAMEAQPAAPAQPQAPTPAPAAPVADESNLHKIVSPMVGTFYRAPEPGAPAYVQVGDKVTPNKVVCIVEAMKLFNEIEAEVTGEIVKVLVEDGQLVEYGQPLFLVKPE